MGCLGLETIRQNLTKCYADCMDRRAAGRRGGAQKSLAKQDASRKNGRKGGRPRKAILHAKALVERMRALYANIGHRCLDVDPDTLGLIIERLCRQPGDGRQFFIYPRSGGGYAF